MSLPICERDFTQDGEQGKPLSICERVFTPDGEQGKTFGLFRVETRLIGFQIDAYDFGPEEAPEFYEGEIEPIINKMTSFEIDDPPSLYTGITYGLSESWTQLEIISIDDPIFKYIRIDMAHRNLQIIWNTLHIVVRFLPILVQFQRRFKERYHSPDGAGFSVCQSRFEMLSCDS